MPRSYLPPETQVVLVSATLPAEVLEMTNKFMTDPIRVLVKRDELTLEVGRDGEGRPREALGRKRGLESLSAEGDTLSAKRTCAL